MQIADFWMDMQIADFWMDMRIVGWTADYAMLILEKWLKTNSKMRRIESKRNKWLKLTYLKKGKNEYPFEKGGS